MSSKSPPKRVARPSKEAVVVYSFGDASGSGFGSSLKIEDTIHYQSGQWKDEIGAESSNYRELSNIINSLETAHEMGLLENTEVFMFTDNSTAEAAVFRGTSKSRKLFDLVLRLQNLQMHGKMMLHFIHVSGKRMIAQGTDGLSQGNTNEGVFREVSFLHFVPLHLSVLERQPHPLTTWVEDWFGSLGPFTWLTPNDWFAKGHTSERCVWTPAPAAAEAALEQLAKSTHKRPTTCT
jgi:hypothetical protein